MTSFLARLTAGPPTRYLRAAEVVEAFQWSGTPPGLHEPEWVGEAIIGGRLTLGRGTILLHTDAGVLKAYPGDWIVREADGSLVPVKRSVFARRYRPAESGPPEPTDHGGTPTPGA